MKARKPGRPRKLNPKQFETINATKGTKADLVALAVLLRKIDGQSWPLTDTAAYAAAYTLERHRQGN